MEEKKKGGASLLHLFIELMCALSLSLVFASLYDYTCLTWIHRYETFALIPVKFQGRRSSGVQSRSAARSTGPARPCSLSSQSAGLFLLRSTANCCIISGSKVPSMASATIRPITGKNCENDFGEIVQRNVRTPRAHAHLIGMAASGRRQKQSSVGWVISYHPVTIRRVRVPENKLKVNYPETKKNFFLREDNLPAQPSSGKRFLCELGINIAKCAAETLQG
jgi:hypothetical protein